MQNAKLLKCKSKCECENSNAKMRMKTQMHTIKTTEVCDSASVQSVLACILEYRSEWVTVKQTFRSAFVSLAGPPSVDAGRLNPASGATYR